ncbi:MAG TPA: extracellular solute-binding protein [Acetobacteraceae bacterium]|nr:extracellular solute-binding protein [Acetobacteraceae bacterium]
MRSVARWAVTRRSVLTAALAAPFLRFAGANAASALNITAYDGFVPAEFRQRFETETGIPVRIRPAASQAPELTLLTAERDHPITDICTVVGTRLHQFVENGIIEPIDTARLKNWSRLNPIYANAEWNRVDGAIMGVPLVMAADVLVFDTREVKPAPDSWSAIFDAKYKGRVTYDIEDFLLCTMLAQGADPTFMSYLGNPTAAAAAVNAARDLLIRNKAQVVRFFDEGSELQQLLTGGDAVLAQTYASTPARLIMAGQPFRRVVPKEGTLAYVYTFAIVKGAPNRDAAYSFLDAMLGAPGMEATLTRSAGYASCFMDAGKGLSATEQDAYGLPEEALGRVHFPRFEGQALSSSLIDKAVEEVKAG